MLSEKHILNSLIGFYKKSGWKKWFVRIRLWDSPYKDIDRAVPESGLILDLGCGDGIITNYLALKGIKRKLIGVEVDSNRVKDADKGLGNTEYKKANILNIRFPKVDTVLMVHLLHHVFSKKGQEKIIKKSVEALAKGGKVIIVEVDYKPRIKYWVSWLVDAFIVPILFEGKFCDFKFTYRRAEEWKRLLEKYGCEVNLQRADKNKPFSHVILVGKKK